MLNWWKGLRSSSATTIRHQRPKADPGVPGGAYVDNTQALKTARVSLHHRSKKVDEDENE